MSQHQVEVVPVTLEKHANADSLSIVKVRGWQVVVRTADWDGRELGAYVEPDYNVPVTRPEFAFLAPKDKDGDELVRVKVARLRGELSQGLLVHAPAGSKLGDDVAEILGVTRYEPPLALFTGGEAEKPPAGYHPVYDVESFNRYPNILQPGEPVIVTEKVHGANGRFLYQDGRFWCGSRTEWKRESDGNLWWRALKACPKLDDWLQTNAGVTAYGEVYGQVQDLKYGVAKSEPPRIALFDVLGADGKWWDASRLMSDAGLDDGGPPTVPIVWSGKFDEAKLRASADGPSLVPGADNIREGVVVKPANERTDPSIGRVILKLISNAYLERA